MGVGLKAKSTPNGSKQTTLKMVSYPLLALKARSTSSEKGMVNQENTRHASAWSRFIQWFLCLWWTTAVSQYWRDFFSQTPNHYQCIFQYVSGSASGPERHGQVPSRIDQANTGKHMGKKCSMSFFFSPQHPEHSFLGQIGHHQERYSGQSCPFISTGHTLQSVPVLGSKSGMI